MVPIDSNLVTGSRSNTHNELFISDPHLCFLHRSFCHMSDHWLCYHTEIRCSLTVTNLCTNDALPESHGHCILHNHNMGSQQQILSRNKPEKQPGSSYLSVLAQ